MDCKGHKYWASSVRAVDSKWRFAGEKHDSDIKENPYGYMNIHSDFVVAMRNFAMNILNNTNCVNISINPYVVNEDDIAEMRSQLVQYLKNGQNFGREFAKLVGQASFDNGFKSNNNFCYQYQRLTDIINAHLCNGFFLRNWHIFFLRDCRWCFCQHPQSRFSASLKQWWSLYSGKHPRFFQSGVLSFSLSVPGSRNALQK